MSLTILLSSSRMNTREDIHLTAHSGESDLLSPLQKRIQNLKQFLPSTFISFPRAPKCLSMFFFNFWIFSCLFLPPWKGRLSLSSVFCFLAAGSTTSAMPLFSPLGAAHALWPFPFFCSEPVQRSCKHVGWKVKRCQCKDTTWAWFEMGPFHLKSFKYINVHLWLQIIGKTLVDTQPTIAEIENLSSFTLYTLWV